MHRTLGLRSSTATTVQQFKNPQEGLGPLTRGFAGYRYIKPSISQVLLGVSNGHTSSSQNPLSFFCSNDKTNVRLLGWPEDPTGSAARLSQWETEGVMHRDPESIYVMEYSVNGVTVCGILVEVDLSKGAGSRIVPHEHTDSTRTMGMREHFSMARVDIEPILLVQHMTSIARTLIDTIKMTAATSIVTRPPRLHVPNLASYGPRLGLQATHRTREMSNSRCRRASQTGIAFLNRTRARHDYRYQQKFTSARRHSPNYSQHISTGGGIQDGGRHFQGNRSSIW